MRLDVRETVALNSAIENIVGEVYLFGSRVFDDKRGGDIDLLVFSSGNSFKLSQQVSVNFFMECEEKIDVIVMDPNNLSEEQQAFLNTITKIRLK